jgi:hypothetical protein
MITYALEKFLFFVLNRCEIFKVEGMCLSLHEHRGVFSFVSLIIPIIGLFMNSLNSIKVSHFSWLENKWHHILK